MTGRGLAGAPIQNKLVELWSLFDFVFPGRLGTLPVFQAEFANPIAAGGFANASTLQVLPPFAATCRVPSMRFMCMHVEYRRCDSIGCDTSAVAVCLVSGPLFRWYLFVCGVF